jgi:hypothetical protein
MEKDSKNKGQKVINVNISDPNRSENKSLSKYLTVFKDGFTFITGASNKSLIKFFVTLISVIILIVGGKVLYNAASSERVMEAISIWIEGENANNEEKGMEIRQDITTPAIQKELRLLCYTLNADRVFLFELHNGKKALEAYHLYMPICHMRRLI